MQSAIGASTDTEPLYAVCPRRISTKIELLDETFLVEHSDTSVQFLSATKPMFQEALSPKKKARWCRSMQAAVGDISTETNCPPLESPPLVVMPG